jgi:hypothetical protein
LQRRISIIAVAKGISSAYQPIAATVVKNSVFDSFYGDPSENRQPGDLWVLDGHRLLCGTARWRPTSSACSAASRRTLWSPIRPTA